MSEFKDSLLGRIPAEGPDGLGLVTMGLRRKVKDGLLTAAAALEWLNRQPHVNPRIKRWLERRIK